MNSSRRVLVASPGSLLFVLAPLASGSFPLPSPACRSAEVQTIVDGFPVSDAITPTVGAVRVPASGFELCSARLDPTRDGCFLAGQFGQTDTPYTFVAGLWVGAEVDRGEGIEHSVSSARWQREFRAVSTTPRTPRFATYHDMHLWPDHEPLGIRVRQRAAFARDPELGRVVRFRWRIENASAEWSPPGWELRNAYVGVMMDADVGYSGELPWADDHAAFQEASGSVPAYAYVYDGRGTADDVDTHVGILLVDEPAHVFRSWSSGADDPTSDDQRYAMMTGASHETPTIDPPTVRSADYRILVTIGPVTIPVGESRTFSMAIACGEEPLESPATETAFAVASPPPVAYPNPVRLSSRAVSFANVLPAVAVEIFDVSGRRVSTVRAEGGPRVRWDLTTGAGRVGTGIYFYRTAGTSGPVAGRILVIAD